MTRYLSLASSVRLIHCLGGNASFSRVPQDKVPTTIFPVQNITFKLRKSLGNGISNTTVVQRTSVCRSPPLNTLFGSTSVDEVFSITGTGTHVLRTVITKHILELIQTPSQLSGLQEKSEGIRCCVPVIFTVHKYEHRKHVLVCAYIRSCTQKVIPYLIKSTLWTGPRATIFWSHPKRKHEMPVPWETMLNNTCLLSSVAYICYGVTPRGGGEGAVGLFRPRGVSRSSATYFLFHTAPTNEEGLYLQSMITRKRFDIFAPDWGMLSYECLDAFRFFFKQALRIILVSFKRYSIQS